ncbi:MAG TPA: DinB family protein [Pedobacter sp.]|nr:DinB family protein [Pedobacter sp.]
MNAVSANKLLNTLELRVDDHLQKAIAIYQNLSDVHLNQPAAGGGWSIASCLEHLNSYGDYYLGEISRAIQKYAGEPGTTARRGWLGNYFIQMMDPDLSVKKYKAFKGHFPAEHLDGHLVVTRFIEQQHELLDLLRRAAGADLNRISIPISLTRFVRLKMGDTFEFIIMHNERHIRQADRNLNGVTGRGLL